MQARVERPDALSAAELESWAAFQAASPALASPFFSPEFTLALGAARRDARVAVLSDGARIRAFWPFHAAPLRVAKPIGGSICDYQGLIHAPGPALDAATVLRAAGLSAYDFNHAPGAQATLAPGAFASAASPLMDLSGGYDAYVGRVADQGSRVVKDTMRKRRKLEREVGPLRFVTQDRSVEAWDALLTLKRAASAAKGARSALDTPWIARAVTHLRGLDGPRFAGCCSTLYAGERLAAVHFGIRNDHVWAWWFPTYDPALSRYSPGLILLLEIAQEAARLGLSSIDLGRGDQRYKLSAATRTVPLLEGAIARSCTLAGALRHAHRMAVRLGDAMPPGKARTLPQRAVRKLIGGGVHLPRDAHAATPAGDRA